ncbi:hypothetical protein GQ600_9312 [Phytophthora cactorum]|nr:hypothetical protein GQ600_9312 [Phytophthora cactorum]
MNMLSIKAAYVPEQKLLNTFATPIVKASKTSDYLCNGSHGDMYNPIVAPMVMKPSVVPTDARD